MYRALLETHPPTLHRGVILVKGQDGLYLHDSIYDALELGLDYTTIPRTRIYLVRIIDVLSQRFRLQFALRGGSQRSPNEGDGGDGGGDGGDDGDEEDGEEHSDYREAAYSAGGQRRVTIYTLLASGIIGYSSPAREKAWRAEIDLHYANLTLLASIVSRIIIPSAIARSGPKNKMSDKHVSEIFVGQSGEDMPNALSISIYPKATFLGIRTILDMSQDEIQSTMYMALGRGISYSGAVYNFFISPSTLLMAVSPTKDGADPLHDTLKTFVKIWKQLLDTPDQCPLPDPPMETRDNRNTVYEVPPTVDGGKKILSCISEILRNGVVISIYASEQFLPRVLKWIKKSSKESGKPGK